MRLVPITSILLAAVLTACGAVHDRAACGASTDCPAGQYCARTSDGNVCWADAVPPVVSAVTVACHDPVVDGSTCLRDGILQVSATITDDKEVAGAEVHLDVGGAPVPLARVQGNLWEADVELARVPFGYFEHAVVTTVVARDGARNTASLEPAGATTVTRHRFARALDTGVFSLGHPAIMADGTVAAAGTNARVYFVPWDGGGISSVVSVGTLQITAAPLAAGNSLWVGSEDNKVYQLKTQAGTWVPTERVDAGGPVRGSLGATSTGYVVATSDFGVVYAIPEVGVGRNSGVGNPYSLGPVIDSNDAIYSAAGGTVRKMTITLGIPGDAWSPATTLSSNVACALSWSDGVVVLPNNGSNAFVTRVNTNGDPVQVATTAVSSDGTAVASDGSILVPEQTKTVSRWTSTGAPFPGWQKPDLGGATRTPLVVTSSAPFLVPTAKGALHALRADGTVAWSGQLSAGTASLQPGNIYTPPGQTPGQELSTAYFAGSDGVLHAIIVDGALDASAPWPKAFHDPRNTNRAGAQP